MAKQTLNDGEAGSSFRGKLNSMFTELYQTSGELDQALKEWAGGKDVEMTARTLDTDGRVTSAILKWPDASSGTFTATNWNVTHECYDGWTKSHTDSGKIVTQAAYTRRIDGAITNKPALTVF